MSEAPQLRKSAPSELIVFKVKYRTTVKNFQISRTTSMDDVVKRILEYFHESAAESKKFRLGIFSGDSLVDYISDSKRFLLKNDLVELVRAPELSSKELIALLTCICECLHNSERLDEVENLSERVEELLHYMTCDEFSDHFFINGGVNTLFEVVTAITQCAHLRSDLRVQLWRQLLSGLAALISYDALLLETGRGVDIIDCPFEGKGFEWAQVPDEIIGQIINCHLFLEDTASYHNCLLILLSFLKTCPDRVQALLDNSIASFLYNALDSSRSRRRLPPLPQSQPKLSRSNSRQSGLAILPKALSPSPSVNVNLTVAGIASSYASASIGSEQGKKIRRISELQILVVCLVHAVYEAAVDSLTETLSVLPPYCISSVIADLMTEGDALEKAIDPMVSPQYDYRDDATTPTATATSSALTRGPNLFSTLKLPRSLLVSGAFSRISRMNSTLNDYQSGQTFVSPLSTQPPSPSGQPPTLQAGIQRPLVDATPISDEKQSPVFTDPMETNLRDMLIKLQPFVVQPYARLREAPLNERQMHRVLRDLCRLILPEITSSTSSTITESNSKVEVYQMCGFANPHKPDDDFKLPPRMLGVVCLSSLVRHRGSLIRKILENQGAFEVFRKNRPVGDLRESAPSPTSLIAWLGADKAAGCPVFPLLPAVRAVSLVLCENFDSIGNPLAEDEQLNPLLFQSSPNADSVFLELFLYCFDTFYDFWFALNAEPCDLERISRALSASLKNAISSCPFTFEGFARELSHFSLDSIEREWRMREEEKEKNHPAVQELHRDLVKQHTETVTKQRLFTMCHGPPLVYMRHTRKGCLFPFYRIFALTHLDHYVLRIQRLHVSLSSEQNLLLVRDSDNHIVEIWPLSSIVTMAPSPDFRKGKHRDWSVVLTIDTDQPTEQEMDIMVRPPSAKQNRHNQIVLGAPSEYIQTSWIDGFSCLRKEKASRYLLHLLTALRSEFTSAAFADDVNLISNLELRIRLFGLNLDTVPTKPIERPPSYPDLEARVFTLDLVILSFFIHAMVSHIKCQSASLRSVDEVLSILKVDKKTGLTNSEALRRYEEIGPNEFQAEPPDPLWLKYLKQFFEPMIGLLIISAFVSILMGQIDDAVSISTAILIVVTVGFIQGYRSEKAIESLKKLMPPKCNCLREGKLHSLVASNLVPGDIIYLSLGDRVPADLRIIESSDLRIDESNLTGETKAVAKRSNRLPSQPSDPCLSKTIEAISPSKSFQTSASTTVFKRNDSFAGSWGDGETIINFGNAPTLPLLPPKQIEGAHCLTNIAFMGTLVCSGNAIGVVIATGEHSEFGEVFKMMQMEEAPRTPLQKSMDRLGKHLSIISGVVILGIVFLGLTQGRNLLELITVAVSPADGEVTLERDDRPHSALRHANLHRLVEIGALCNNASLKDGILCGQPTEGALLCLAAKMRIPDPRLTNTRIKEWPFNSDQKLMVVQVAPTRLSKPCTSTYFIKGAPDRVIPLCAYYRSAAITATTDLGSVTPLGESDRLNILAEASRMAASGGLRVLALAEGSSVDRDFIFAGLVGLLDPPRPDMESAVETCYRSGVRVIMITGDAKETACAIGSRLSLYRPGDMCLSGEEVETMDMHQLQSQIHCVTVFYRTGPRHKCKIVKALQNRGLVVAMTGDGVNDAIALKSADIGVAMGASGTDVCKEAADVVLLDDAFSSVLAAMEEGKALFANICNFIRFQLSTSIAALSLIAVSTTLSLPNPLNAMQILYINILMDGPPAQSLGVEPPDADVVNQPPRHVQESILDRRLIKSVLISALMIVCGTLFIFHREMAADGKVTPRDTTMTFTCFVLFDMFNALACRSQKKSVFKIGFFSNRVFVVAVSLSLIGQICVIYFPPLQSVFQTEAIFASDWLLLLAISSSVFVVSEYRKSKLSVSQLFHPRKFFHRFREWLQHHLHRGPCTEISRSIV
ncbi:unnamed protein product [Taenia asiatica]|uniref:P-type Ca(2+) transporter n=1 Tax=Taenia asiatica TaxID=60517 RepID=A0A0R3W500_TAEAS|nr:unnamed protein product [Taenia asiatica]